MLKSIIFAVLLSVSFIANAAVPEYFESPVAERYADMPIRGDSSGARCIMYIPVPHPVVGEVWDISSEIHVTNDSGVNAYIATQVLLGGDTGHDRTGVSLQRANGTFNVTPQNHHGLVSRRAPVKWTQEMVDLANTMETVYVKYIIYSGSTAWNSSTRMDITPNRGHLRMLRYVPAQ